MEPFLAANSEQMQIKENKVWAMGILLEAKNESGKLFIKNWVKW
jgi:hypothetical protein